jgi:hypothetical protein
MNAALGTLRRRERELVARRRKAEGRASRERSRNSRIALACFVALAGAITFGVRTTWVRPAVKLALNVATDPDSQRFAENHIGRLFFDSLDGAICREMQFNNDNGRFSDERTMRCDEFRFQESSANAPETEARARAFSIRSGFSSR